MSPVVDGGRVIVHRRRQQRRRARRRSTRRPAPRPGRGRATGRAMPRRVVATCDGVRAGRDADPERARGRRRRPRRAALEAPLQTPYEQNSVTPLVDRGPRRLLGPRRAAAPRVRPVKKGAGVRAREPSGATPTWRATCRRPCSTDGRIYGLSHKKKGQWFCVDAASGKHALAGARGAQGENAAMLGRSRRAVPARHDGALTVAAADATAFRRSEVDGRLVGDLGAPCGAGRRVLVKDVDTLALLRIR